MLERGDEIDGEIENIPSFKRSECSDEEQAGSLFLTNAEIMKQVTPIDGETENTSRKKGKERKLWEWF